ncbi:mannose-6-phosphate isomerase [Acerihabitans arboris]|uniref:Mannose-6-phosphate isomerase n=1 Tax=Acerihabitans arboris TaxID=2691583 RepID=A0A845SPM2_9GAMM|nr:mannose-6-phosphate isomerase [Acerihabitans arboris]NDL63125.1 mannose-6-phosphate isomerase [Acerihabitans arboris]
MKKMINSVQHYAWGSKDALTRLYGIANPGDQPMAELWMGAHPKSSSRISDDRGNDISLRDYIAQQPGATLGKAVARRFGELPFLFKVLCAQAPLSIQVHPSKSAAERGFALENDRGVPIDAANRNYKDPNHKPELVFALTPFQAMNGFREITGIVSLLQPVAGAHPAIARFLQHPDRTHLAQLFGDLLGMTGEEKSLALDVLKSTLGHQHGEPWETIGRIAEDYPDDSGLFSPLLLNVITLQPGQAMFLYAETPHAYLRGEALEVMANSDNVLRAGLTPKYIDVPELLANVQFVAKPEHQLLARPVEKNGALRFAIPVEDFAFSLHNLSSAPQRLAQDSAAILFCVDGQAVMEKDGERLTLKPGESAFLAAGDSPVNVSGNGRLARVFNEL